jgi:nucleoside-diphosphate-sugar epimerase
VDDLQEAVDFRPRTSIQDGLHRFVEWYRAYKRK